MEPEVLITQTLKNLPAMRKTWVLSLGQSLGEDSPKEGNGYPPKYSCLEKSMDRGAWQATVHRVTATNIFTFWDRDQSYVDVM